MNSKERMLCTIRGEKPDRIPVHHIQFSGDAASKVILIIQFNSYRIINPNLSLSLKY